MSAGEKMKLKKIVKEKEKQTVLKAKIIRRDGTVEDLGVIARGDAIKNSIKIIKNG